MDDLQAQILAAHEADDRTLLVTLYTRAADAAAGSEAEWFFLTHAYVFALETDHPARADLHARLQAAGREE